MKATARILTLLLVMVLLGGLVQAVAAKSASAPASAPSQPYTVSADNWNDMGVDAVATDPVDPNRLYLLVGTYTNSWTSQNGVIMRSTDKGNTFTRIGLSFKVGGNMPGRNMGERLVIDPNLTRSRFIAMAPKCGGRNLRGGFYLRGTSISRNRVDIYNRKAFFRVTPTDYPLKGV